MFYTWVRKRRDDYLFGDDHAAYQRRDNRGDSGGAIGDGHHGPGEVRTEINMIDLETAQRSSVQTYRQDEDDDGPDVTVGGYDTH